MKKFKNFNQQLTKEVFRCRFIWRKGKNRIVNYITGIIYKLKLSCYSYDVRKRKRNTKGSGKEKDMATMNRLYCIYSESCRLAHLYEHEVSFGFMHPFIDKHKRKNCVLDI